MRDGEVGSCGLAAPVPLAAMLLAQRRHAPNLTLTMEGALNPKVIVLMLGTNNSRLRMDPPEAIAAGIKRPAGPLRRVVIGGERPEQAERRQTDRVEHRVVAARQHEIGLPARRHLGQRDSFVVLLDDLEHNRRPQAREIFERYRGAMDAMLALLGPELAVPANQRS
jgi:hypothetical protein